MRAGIRRATRCCSRSRSACAGSAEPGMMLGRIGGDEFAVLLRDTDADRATRGSSTRSSPLCAVARPAVPHRCVDRLRAGAASRQRRRRAAVPRGHGALCGQESREGHLPDVLAGHGIERAGAGRARIEAARRAGREPGAVRVLPADRRCPHPPDHGARGAAALASSAHRLDIAGLLHSGGRARRPDRPARPLRARAGLPGGARWPTVRALPSTCRRGSSATARSRRPWRRRWPRASRRTGWKSR